MLCRRKMICAVCGRESEHRHFRSITMVLGEEDMDDRRGGWAERYMYCFTPRCPHCGYSAPDLSKASYRARIVVKTRAYADILSNKALPEAAITQLCTAAIAKIEGDTKGVARAYVWAAWAMDDEKIPDKATEFRMQAFEAFSSLGPADQQPVVMADLLRRAGQFDQARQFCLNALQDGCDLHGIRAELAWIDAQDASVKTAEQARKMRRKRGW